MIVFFSLLTGLIVGSFLNVVILRGEKGISLGGRSRCPSCKKTLRPRELIPIASFLIQKGRCRSCGAVLSWQYPLVELATALFFAAGARYILGNSISLGSLALLLVACIGIAAALVIVVSDLRFQIIPDGAVLVLFFLGAAASIIRAFPSFLQSYSILQAPHSKLFLSDWFAALVLALFFASLWFVSRGRWMGLGDAKLTFATSLALGYPASITGFLFSVWLGGLAGLMMLGAGAAGRKTKIPFGPFIIAGSTLAFFFSDRFLMLTGAYAFF